jgi:hypothetical protein
MRFSKSRRRYERQGLLVEPQALMQAQRELETQIAVPVAISDGEPKRPSIAHDDEP